MFRKAKPGSQNVFILTDMRPETLLTARGFKPVIFILAFAVELDYTDQGRG